VKRRLLIGLCALGGAAACMSQSLPLPISIVGLNDLTRTGYTVDAGLDLLFMTSSDENELRVLNLNPLLNPRDFVRGPNPIEPLSIPVLNSPVALAHDVGWDINGMQTSGPYVYARGMASSDISVVAADVSQLYEYCRLLAGDTVTAIAARAPVPENPASPSSLYFATSDGTNGTLWQADLPPPIASEALAALPRVWSGDHYVCVLADGSDGGAVVPFAGRVLSTFPGQTVTTLMLVPSPDPSNAAWEQSAADPNLPILLALATHASADGGQTVLFNTETLQTRSLGFPAPVTRMVSNEQTENTLLSTNPVVWQGTYIYGTLDESSCADQPSCNGILALNTSTGGIALDISGLPMLPIAVEGALLTGLAVTPSNLNADIAAVIYVSQGNSGLNPDQQLPLLGALSSSNGGVYFWDALQMIPINGLNSAPAINADSSGNPIIDYGFSDGGLYPLEPNTGVDVTSFYIGAGAVMTETVSLTFQGLLPPLIELPVTPLGDGGLAFSAPAGLDWSRTLFPNDIVQLSNCSDEFPATDVSASTFSVDLDGGVLPADCAASTTFSVRAGPVAQFVVFGTVDGYMGRVSMPPAPIGGPSASTHTCDWSTDRFTTGCFRFPDPQQGGAGTGLIGGTYYYHPPGVLGSDGGSLDPAATPLCGGTPPLPCALAFSTLFQDNTTVTQDIQYSFEVLSNFQTEFMTVDPRVGTGFQLPGAMAFDPILQTLYVSFPAADGIVEVAPLTITPNTPNYLNLPVYR
jgi:hypothetical protein